MKEATKYYKLAADNGSVNGMFQYAYCMENGGNGIRKNFEEAAKYYKLAADNGCHEAMNNYGCCLSKGKGVKKNMVEAGRYFKMSANRGCLVAKENYEKDSLYREIPPKYCYYALGFMVILGFIMICILMFQKE